MEVYAAYYGAITILFIILTKYRYRITLCSETARKTALQRSQRQMALFMAAATIGLVFIIGFRSDHQGSDLYNSLGTGYFFYYESINKDSLGEILRNFSSQKYANFEIGFVLFCKLLGTVCGNHQILLLGCAALSIVPVGCFIAGCSRHRWLSMVLFMALPCFATVEFSALRQGCAMGIAALSYGFAKRKKPIRFIAGILLASTFHSSAIVALVVYPAYHATVSRRSALFGGIGGLAAIYLTKETLFWILAKIVHNNPKLSRTDSVNMFLILTVIYILCVYFSKDSDYGTRGYTNILWIACAAQAFSGLHNLAGRITWYFMLVLVVLVPDLLENPNIKERHIARPLTWMVGALAVMLGLYYLRNNQMACAYPYVPFWRA